MFDTGLLSLLFVFGVLNFVFLYILIITKPFLGIIFIMIMHFWFGSIEVGIYPRILSIIFVALILIPILAVQRKINFENINVDVSTKKILGIAIALFIWEIFVNQVIHQQGLSVLIATMGKVFIPILLSTLIYILIQNRMQFSRYIFILILLISISALTGIFQFFDFSWAWKLRTIQGNVVSSSEPCGLSLYSLHFSYMLAYAFPLIVSLVLKDKFMCRSNIFFASTGVLIFIALILTAVRSAILGLLIGTLYTLFKIKKYKKGLMAVLMIGMVFILMVHFIDVSSVLDTITTFDDKSAVGRKPLFLTGLYIAKDNLLFGIGTDKFNDYAELYYGKVYHLRGAESIAYLPPHNQFIAVLVYYGVPGFLLLSMFYMFIIKNLTVVQKKSMDKYCFHVSAGLLGSHISYIVTSFFHNMGPFITDPYVWFVIAASFICFKLR